MKVGNVRWDLGESLLLKICDIWRSKCGFAIQVLAGENRRGFGRAAVLAD